MNPLLEQLPRFATAGVRAIHPGLDRIGALLAAMEHPENGMSVILVAGTNGKGSVASMIASILTASGFRTGLHTSPHLLDVTERMRIDGQPAPSAWLDAALEHYREDVLLIGPSFFEVLVAFSILWFRESGVDVAVVEVGLGGRLDATNILDADVSVITSIGLDHTELLGTTLPAIAREKGGIIKPGRPVVLGRMDADAEHELVLMADTAGAQVVHGDAGKLPAGTRVDLPGPHQHRNALVAVAAVRAWSGRVLTDGAIRDGLGDVQALSGLRARLETVSVSPRVIVDMGHNADAIASALAALSSEPVDVLVLGLLRDKDAAAVGRVLRDAFRGVLWLVSTPGDRGQSASELARGLSRDDARLFSSVTEACDEIRHAGTSCLCIGSHHVAAEALRAFS